MDERTPLGDEPAAAEVSDIGGESACWLDEVCISCGAVGGHRPGCDLAEPADELVTGEVEPRKLFSLPAQPPDEDE